MFAQLSNDPFRRAAIEIKIEMSIQKGRQEIEIFGVSSPACSDPRGYDDIT
jgi:hypothetical protein